MKGDVLLYKPLFDTCIAEAYSLSLNKTYRYSSCFPMINVNDASINYQFPGSQPWVICAKQTPIMKTIKVFGWHCPECEATLSNIKIAMQITGVTAILEVIESPEELVHNDIFSIPVVKVDGEVKVKGRIPGIIELREILLN